MQITPIRGFDLDQLAFEAGPPRSAGLHLSQITGTMLADLDPAKYGGEKTYPASYRETGFAFEHVLEQAFAARRIDIVRPGEFVQDGIICSPDGISVNDWTLEEFKCTWKSSRGAPYDKKFASWLWQMKAYCHVIGTTNARLRALFINGDYSKGFVPEAKAWDVVFTERELDENWQMICSNAAAKGML